MKRCLQGEEVPLDVQGVRERVLRIGRVVQVVGDAQGAEFCARWLIGTCPNCAWDLLLTAVFLFVAQLKVNLRPLWSPAAAALSSLSQRFGNVVWDLIFSEIRKGGEQTSRVAERHYEASQMDEETGDDIWEDERSWRDPSAHKLRVVLARWLDSEYRVKELAKVRYSRCVLQLGY